MPPTTPKLPVVWPRRAAEIPIEWYRLVLDGNLWRLRITDLPFQISHLHSFKLTFIRRADSLQRKASLRFSPDGSVLFIQARFRNPDETPGWSPKLPYEQALDAPPIPPIQPKQPVVKQEKPVRVTAEMASKMPLKAADYSGAIARLLAEQEAAGEALVPATRVVDHPVIGWAMAECDCGTDNFRTHPRWCRCYSTLGLVEHQVNRLLESPEAWARKNTPRQ